MTCALAGNISGEATDPLGNIWLEATRQLSAYDPNRTFVPAAVRVHSSLEARYEILFPAIAAGIEAFDCLAANVPVLILAWQRRRVAFLTKTTTWSSLVPISPRSSTTSPTLMVRPSSIIVSRLYVHPSGSTATSDASAINTLRLMPTRTSIACRGRTLSPSSCARTRPEVVEYSVSNRAARGH